MKRNIVIATIAAAALVGGGTATALAVTSHGGAATTKPSSVRPADDGRDDDGRDDDGRDDDAGETDARDDGVGDTDDRDGDADARDADDGQADDGRTDDDAVQGTSGKVTAVEAISSALRHTPGTAVSADLDAEDDGGPAVWDVDILAKGSTWHSVQIDPATGKVLGSHVEHEDGNDTAQVRAALKGSSVSAEEAAKAAAAKGTVTSVDLDEDGKSKAWDAETRASGGAEREWNVDLKTAQVTADKSADQDSADDDANDAEEDGSAG
ncbi:PepSY domain-containing protein [Streptomyces ureilyticus]|uniref:PepSY domain-containing protein n=1 Tax=Streptomyces ureilyticus TaxID=1775131 RepID=A0ABX0DRN6_9ACTN|nr:PepSY domain-containing protein [Streptomyces ureilyticus]NGO44025.1 PepSY domain-containing protein [Streptomyces ureilyticus]